MKGVVLAGGTGTRLCPLTVAVNKHLLPIGKYPMIYYPLSTLVNGGIDEILVICGGNHLDGFIELLGEEYDNIPLTYRVQNKPDGIAGAISRVERWVGKESFVVILGDNIFEDIFTFKDVIGARIYIQYNQNPEQYGVPEFKDDVITGFEEKPGEPKSHYAVTGLYQFDEQVFSFIKQCQPSNRNELEITDVLNHYARKGMCGYTILKSFWCDAGTFEGMSLSNFHFLK